MSLLTPSVGLASAKSFDCLEGTAIYLDVMYKGQTQEYRFCSKLPDDATFVFGINKLQLKVKKTLVTIRDDSVDHTGTAESIGSKSHMDWFDSYRVSIE